jgi:diguanylate cyclase (GGDEF)-like protein/PAS domain S-box-containing protein
MKEIERFFPEYRSSIGELPVMFYSLEPEEPYSPIYFSPLFGRFGYPLKEWYRAEKSDWSKFLHPDDRKAFQEETTRALKGEKEKRSIYRIVGKDGKIYRVYDRAYFIRDREGKKICWQGVIIDLTDHSFIEEILSHTGNFYFHLFWDSSDLVYLSDFDGKWILVNPAVEKILGYSRDEILNKLRAEQIVLPDSLPIIKEKLQEKITGKATSTIYQADFLARDGRIVTLEINSRLLYDDKGKPIAVQGIARDITERRKLTETLRNSEAEIQAILAALPECIFVIDDQGNLIKIPSAKSLSILGKDFSDLVGKSIREIIPPDHEDFFLMKVRESLRKNQIVNFEIDLKTSREDAFYEVSLSPMTDKTLVMIIRDITERKYIMQALRDSEERYRDLFENANDVIYTHDLQGNYTDVNKAGELLTGYTKEEIKNLNFTKVVAPEYIDLARKMFKDKLRTGKSTSYELEILSKDGRRIALEVRTRLVLKDGRPVAVHGIGRDITEKKRIERVLKESEELYRLVTENVMHHIWIASSDGEIQFANSRCLEFFGCSLEELKKQGWRGMFHPDDLPKFLKELSSSLKEKRILRMEARLRSSDGDYLWHAIRCVPRLDENNRVTGLFGTNTDINEKKQLELELSNLAKYDTLTGLINRSHFMLTLRELTEKAEKNPDFKFALLFLDLDRFKIINDTFGHSVGGEVLKIVAKRLKRCVRPNDVIARLGGDEIIVLLNGIKSSEDALSIVERILNTINQPFNIKGHEIFTSASVGVVFSDGEIRRPEEYLCDADLAMYRVKEKGRAGYEVFTPQMRNQSINFLQLDADLRHSISNDDFRVFYQPIMDLQNNEIVGIEALLRWNHPVLGILSPKDFIDVAEETGQIVEIRQIVLQKACSQLSEWQKEFNDDLFMCINLSAKEFWHPNLYQRVIKVLEDTRLKPSSLCFEINENVVFRDGILAGKVLTQLHELGVLLSTDDFGTGYSSLNYVADFPFQWLKIDKSFVNRANEDKKRELMIKTSVMIGESLDVRIIAEGIENSDQLELLKSHGCRFGQGYFFSKPLDADSMTEYLEKCLRVKRY